MTGGPAGLASKGLGPAAVDRTVGLTPTAGTGEPMRPRGLRHRRFALCLDAVLGDDVGHRYSHMKLDSILTRNAPLQ